MSYAKEYVATLTATLSVLSTGTHLGWTSPTIPFLLSTNSPIQITGDQSSWIVSLKALGSIIGPIIGAVLVTRFGRKNTLVFTGIPYLLSWILIAVAQSVVELYIARFIVGLAYGVTYTVLPMYLGEIASTKIRGALGTFTVIMTKAGILLSYSIGPYVEFRTLPYILMVFPIILLLSYFWLPESPYYFLMKNKNESAMSSLKSLRGCKDVKELEDELNAMEDLLKMRQENKGTLKELFQLKGNRRALLIMFICISGMINCGVVAILAYTQQFFEAAGGVLGPSESAIVLGLVQLVTALISGSIVDRIGRRPLLLVSMIGVAIFNAMIGTYFFCKEQLLIDVSTFSWLLLTLVLVHVAGYMIGLATATYAVMGEIFPANVKALASCICIMYSSILTFGVTKLYQVVKDGAGTYAAFWGFSILSAINVVFMVIFLPETKGLSFAQIQLNLNK